ncbi:MAG: pirin family protein [Sporichthyaceae bacterium]
MSTTAAGGPVTCGAEGSVQEPVVLPFTAVPLGGPRAMTVRRSLPQRRRSLIGAWCFVDHYGPDDVAASGGMAVPGHPHTGLATASWLFTGQIEHRDTTGAHAWVRPGELNLMTAGSGIAHSEFSALDTPVLHGVQLWLALPAAARFVDPSFHHYAPEEIDLDGATARVFLGGLFGAVSPVATHTALIGAELRVDAGRSVVVDLDPEHEHGFLCDTGLVHVADRVAEPGEVVYVPRGRRQVVVSAPVETRLLVLGGEPFGERIVMWWNFVGRTHEEVVDFRATWQREREELLGGRFGHFPAEWTHTLPAPEMPTTTLRPRG